MSWARVRRSDKGAMATARGVGARHASPLQCVSLDALRAVTLRMGYNAAERHAFNLLLQALRVEHFVKNSPSP